MAIRSALGAHSRRLVRQLLTESLLLAVVAAALGLIGAYFALQLLIKLGPPEIPRLEQTAIDVDVLMLTLGLSFFAIGFAFSRLPLSARAAQCIGFFRRA